jgi:SAM-dependent methyltransferase
MAETSRHDAWQAGDSYEAYMGRWSRPIAARFLDWLAMPDGLDWLDVGCGTGALSGAVVKTQKPKSLVAVDPSAGFVAKARENVPHAAADFRVGDAQSLPLEANSRDVAVSALALNFIPDKVTALREMKRVTRPGGTIAFYVWDYPGGGVEFMRAFWEAATALDPAAGELTEDSRFPFCTPAGLAGLAEEAGLGSVACTALEAPTVFRDFEDYWTPFTLGAGPAPGYCVSLAPAARECLKAKLSETLPRRADGAIPLKARAWALKTAVT